jgi:hypothetical protein
LKLTFLAQDAEGAMRLIKCTSASDTPDIDVEWNKALERWKEKVPLLGDMTLVGALAVTKDESIRWYPDVVDDGVADMVGRTLH